MTRPFLNSLILGLTTLGLGTTGVFAQAVDVIAHENVPASSLNKAALKDVLLGKTAYWEGGQAVTIIILTEKTDAGVEEASGMTASAFRTFWQRLAFSGRGKQPKQVDTVEKLVAAVAETKGAVALAPAGTVLKGVKKIEIK